jgi:hypothetical protein
MIRSRKTGLAIALLGVLLCSPLTASAGVFDVALGTAAPGPMLGPYTMTPFPLDPRPLTTVSTVASPLGGDVGLTPAAFHTRVAVGWATWSNGYAGDVYFDGGTTEVMTMPAGTGAFRFYVESNVFATFAITATSNGGASVTQSVNGSAGAAGYGFYATDGDMISTITVSVPGGALGFATGEYSIAAALAPVPEPATLGLCGVAALILAGYGWRRWHKAA